MHRLMDVKEVSEILKLPRQRIYELTRRGLLACFPETPTVRSTSRLTQRLGRQSFATMGSVFLARTSSVV